MQDASPYFTAAEAIDVALEVARGLEFIHNAGYIHQSLRPDNIVFADKPWFQKPRSAKIIDFGNSIRFAQGNAPLALNNESARAGRYIPRGALYRLNCTCIRPGTF